MEIKQLPGQVKTVMSNTEFDNIGGCLINWLYLTARDMGLEVTKFSTHYEMAEAILEESRCEYTKEQVRTVTNYFKAYNFMG